jgi:hypothetical protein
VTERQRKRSRLERESAWHAVASSSCYCSPNVRSRTSDCTISHDLAASDHNHWCCSERHLDASARLRRDLDSLCFDLILSALIFLRAPQLAANRLVRCSCCRPGTASRRRCSPCAARTGPGASHKPNRCRRTTGKGRVSRSCLPPDQQSILQHRRDVQLLDRRLERGGLIGRLDDAQESSARAEPADFPGVQLLTSSAPRRSGLTRYHARKIFSCLVVSESILLLLRQAPKCSGWTPAQRGADNCRHVRRACEPHPGRSGAIPSGAPAQISRWSGANTRRPAAKHVLGMGVVSALRASRADGVRAVRHPLGTGCLERQASTVRTLHRLRPQGRDAAASELG